MFGGAWGRALCPRDTCFGHVQTLRWERASNPCFPSGLMGAGGGTGSLTPAGVPLPPLHAQRPLQCRARVSVTASQPSRNQDPPGLGSQPSKPRELTAQKLLVGIPDWAPHSLMGSTAYLLGRDVPALSL